MISITDFLGDRTDDGPAIQAAINSLSRPSGKSWYDCSGGVITFPPDRYTVKTTINIPFGGVKLVGEGNPWTRHVPCGIYYKGDSHLFEFTVKDKNSKPNGFSIENFALIDGYKKSTAFKFTGAKFFAQDIQFKNLACLYWDKVFDIDKENSTCFVWGRLTMDSCQLSYNTQVMNADPGHINMTEFNNCTISKNTPAEDQYVIEATWGDNIVFNHCAFEGEPRVLRASNVHGLSLRDCRAEGNKEGDPLFLMKKCRGVVVDNFYYRPTGVDKREFHALIRLEECDEYRIDPKPFGEIQVVKTFNR